MFEDFGSKLSRFGSNVKQGATNLGSQVKQGATNLSGSISLNGKIDIAKKDLKQTFADLGEKFYQEKGKEVPEEYKAYFERIEQIKKVIADAQQELRNLNGIRICPRCGADVERDCVFCTNCGNKMEEPVPNKPMPGKILCRSCGREIAKESKFCNFCGQPAQVPEAPAEPAPYVIPNAQEETPAAENIGYAENVENTADAATTATTEEQQLCPQCGAQIRVGAAFCTKCGNKLQ